MKDSRTDAESFAVSSSNSFIDTDAFPSALSDITLTTAKGILPYAAVCAIEAPSISAAIQKDFGYDNVKDIFKLSPSDQTSLAKELFYTTSAFEWQIWKYFRWKKV